VDFAESGGKGTVGGEWDGWQLCNGQNGAPNLSDKFIIAAKMDDLGIGFENGDGPWKTNVTTSPTQEGAGVHEITLDTDNTFRPARGAVEVRRWEADGNTPNDSSGSLYGIGSGVTLLGADAGKETPDPIPTLPPYYALAFAIFVGYA
jgi:hypothetical protein